MQSSLFGQWFAGQIQNGYQQMHASNRVMFFFFVASICPEQKVFLAIDTWLLASPETSPRVDRRTYSQSFLCGIQPIVNLSCQGCGSAPPPRLPPVNGFVCSFKVDMGFW